MEADLAQSNEEYFTNESRRLIDRIAQLQKEISLEKAYKQNEASKLEAARTNFSCAERFDHDERLRYLMDENQKLKHELEKNRGHTMKLSEKNGQLILENRRLKENQAEVCLLRKQVQAMRGTIEKLPADEAAAQIRIEVLEDRLQDVQRQNFDLRRQLAGLTPERNKTIPGVLDCEKCVELQKQKALQTRYIIAQTTENRRLVEEHRSECQKLKTAVETLQTKNSEMEAKYKKELKDVTEYRDLYRRHNERSAKWFKTQVQGFTNDVIGMKSKVTDLEKCLIKVHSNSETEKKQRQLIEELKNIATEAASVANEIRRWKSTYD